MARRSNVRGAIPFARGPRRETEWGSVTTAAPIVVAAGTSVVLASFTGLQLESIVPATLVRVRGLLAVQSDQGAAFEDAMGAFGIYVPADPARIAGVASLLTPITDAFADNWQTWQGFMSTGQRTGNAVAWNEYTIDSKAMRKIADGDSLVLIAENAHATAGLQVAVQLRLLFKLH